MPQTPFKDFFSLQAEDYARYRPQYPDALFDVIAGSAPSRQLAWDCATGNGQAAVGLARKFEKVIATDASQKQIEQAFCASNITYLVSPGENAPIDDNALDAVTVAQALHWLNLDAFYREVHRTLKPEGVIAVWCYGGSNVQPEIDSLVQKLYSETLKDYWDPVVALVDQKYQTIPFPFFEIETPEFEIESRWNLSEFLCYIRTWSGTNKCISSGEGHLIQPSLDEIAALWGDPETARPIRTRLYTRIGRLAK